MDQNDQNQQDQSHHQENPSGPQGNPVNRGDSSPSGHLQGGLTEIERRYTMSISDEDRKKSFEIEDRRWATSEQIKDWLKLLVMMIITAIWCLTVYFLQPGLR
jgi:hypothetical protein